MGYSNRVVAKNSTLCKLRTRSGVQYSKNGSISANTCL